MKYILMSGFNLHSSNRGTAALGYGSVSFLKDKGHIPEGDQLLKLSILSNGKDKFKKSYIETKHITIQGISYVLNIAHISYLEYLLVVKFGLKLSFGFLHCVLSKTRYVAAINGGDGFSDIYGTMKFRNCIIDSKLSILYNVPLIILPQTIGPFADNDNLKCAKRILNHASEIYVRDDKYVNELSKMGLKFTITKDLSSFMQPEPFDIDIKDNSVGLNISGLAYSNNYGRLSGQFSSYPLLVDKIIKHFQDKGCSVYLIPHSYNVKKPDFADDDYEACQKVYKKLKNKSNVYFVNHDLISPQVKYVISKMTFFIGMRMHANFAAIYTNTPVFGLAYSYKFAGAFVANGLSDKQTYLINNLRIDEIEHVVSLIDETYRKLVNHE